MTALQISDKHHISADSEFGHLLTSSISHGLIGFTKVTKLGVVGSLQGGVLFQGIKRPLHHLCNKYFTHKVGNVVAIAASIGIATTCVWLMVSHGHYDFTYWDSLKLNLSGCAGSELSHKAGTLAIAWLKKNYGKEEAAEIVHEAADIEHAVIARSPKADKKSDKTKQQPDQTTGLLSPIGLHQGSRVSYVP